MGTACSTYEGLQGFVGGNLLGRDHLIDPGVDWRIILKWNLEKLDRSG